MESHFTSKAVGFLEPTDFISPSKFRHALNGRLMIVMVGASFCGYCTEAAPDFNTFALENKQRVFCSVVPADGTPGQQILARDLGTLGKFQSIPTFLLYDRNGNFIKVHKERSKDSFIRLCANY